MILVALAFVAMPWMSQAETSGLDLKTAVRAASKTFDACIRATLIDARRPVTPTDAMRLAETRCSEHKATLEQAIEALQADYGKGDEAHREARDDIGHQIVAGMDDNGPWPPTDRTKAEPRRPR